MLFAYTYDENETDTDYTSTRVDRIITPAGTFVYHYDDAGNITEIYDDSEQLLNEYIYDELGQLVQESSRVMGKAYVYTYDLNGNRTKMEEYPVDTTTKSLFVVNSKQRTLTYSYSSGLWHDQMTGYTTTREGSDNSTSLTITYDAIGNPTNYFGTELEWGYGRTLTHYDSGLYDISYQYNADGMLTRQTVNYSDLVDFEFNNYYDGDRLVYRVGSDFEAWYDYDETGSPIAMTLTTGGTTSYYYFIKNLQGDVIAIADTSGTIVRKYNYDAWGKLVSITDGNNVECVSVINTSDPAIANPFRYRSYFYDDYAEKYWLQTRFYDPVTGRFINADGCVTTGQGVLSSNMYIYCLNNPIMLIDLFGELPGDLFYTMDEAAIDLANYINARSISENREYWSEIYQVRYRRKIQIYRTKRFLFWEWTESEESYTDITYYRYDEPVVTGEKGGTIEINHRYTIKALFHTHGSWKHNSTGEYFSPEDLKSLKKMNVVFYLATPKGVVKKREISSIEDIEIYWDAPYDPKHPDKR